MSPSQAPSAPLPTAFRAGALAALGTWAMVALPALIGWVSAPESTLPWWSGLAVGSAIWFLGHGQSVGVAGISVSVTPLLLLAAFGYVAWRSARRLLAIERGLVRGLDWDARLWRGLVPGYLFGYGAGAAVFALLTLAGPVRPAPLAVLGALLVPVLGLGVALLRPGQATTPAVVRRVVRRGPVWLSAAGAAMLRGAGLLFVAGGALALLRVLGTVGTVVHIQGEYDAGLVAGFVLALAQVAFLGNVATWGLAFLAGPGFSVATGGVISPGGAEPGLMPLVPILGALPETARYPSAMWAVLAVPVLIGGLVARWVYRVEAEWPVRDRLAGTGAALLGAVVLVAAATALGNGAVGAQRLAAVGPPVLPMAGALLAEVLIGAGLWIGWRSARIAWSAPRRVATKSRSSGQDGSPSLQSSGR